MKQNYPHIKLMGERAILIDFEPIIDEILLEKILFSKEAIEKSILKDKVEVINTYHSLLVLYHNTIENIYDEVLVLKSCCDTANIGKKINSYIYHVPVCYDEEFGLDLKLISKQNKLSIPEIIQLHTSSVYTVYFIGFLPGFLYLGGLDKRLKISRKETPRMEVQKGAVGIGENQTGIYPKTSPGGWQIIGNSPVSFFDKYADPPCVISPGDKVKFHSISKNEFNEISEADKRGDFQLKNEKYHG
jgi:inhibitor of KinA